MMGWINTLFVLGVASVFGTAVAADNGGDIDRGQKIYKKCVSCHMIGPEARNRLGPPLNNIIAAKAAGVADFKYSPAMRRAAEDGLLWTRDILDAFLTDPRDYIPKTKMSFSGLKKSQDRADVIAYLATFSDGEMAAQVDAGFVVSPEIIAIKGDFEYGEYLSSECTTCHLSSGNNDGIPGIVGWEIEDFVTAMHAYKEKHRENPVMQMITGRLGNEEIAALAAYFKTLEN